jgi:hypothetical protein
MGGVNRPTKTSFRESNTLKKTVFITALAVLSSVVTMAAPATPTVYVAPDNGFEVAIVAGLAKKQVPVTITAKPEDAEFTLVANTVQVHQESAGSKIARCLFAYCIGIEDSGSVSVQLIDNHTKAIVWAYNVNKQRGGQSNQQSMAEAIAKHLNNDFLKKR